MILTICLLLLLAGYGMFLELREYAEKKIQRTRQQYLAKEGKGLIGLAAQWAEKDDLRKELHAKQSL